MELPTIFIFTHDAMGDGEDGPTHQPVEHLASLACHSRPGHAAARRRQRSRRSVPLHHATAPQARRPRVVAPAVADVGSHANTRRRPASRKGAYVLADAPGGNPEVILIASGSEVSLAVEAHEKLVAEGIRSRVVSMPSWDIFEHQTQEYRDSVLPPDVKARVAIEQASTFGWERYVGRCRSRHRHENVRRVGAAQGTPEEVRLRASRNCDRSKTATRSPRCVNQRKDSLVPIPRLSRECCKTFESNKGVEGQRGVDFGGATSTHQNVFWMNPQVFMICSSFLCVCRREDLSRFAFIQTPVCQRPNVGAGGGDSSPYTAATIASVLFPILEPSTGGTSCLPSPIRTRVQ